ARSRLMLASSSNGDADACASIEVERSRRDRVLTALRQQFLQQGVSGMFAAQRLLGFFACATLDVQLCLRVLARASLFLEIGDQLRMPLRVPVCGVFGAGESFFHVLQLRIDGLAARLELGLRI